LELKLSAATKIHQYTFLGVDSAAYSLYRVTEVSLNRCIWTTPLLIAAGANKMDSRTRPPHWDPQRQSLPNTNMVFIDVFVTVAIGVLVWLSAGQIALTMFSGK